MTIINNKRSPGGITYILEQMRKISGKVNLLVQFCV